MSCSSVLKRFDNLPPFPIEWLYLPLSQEEKQDVVLETPPFALTLENNLLTEQNNAIHKKNIGRFMGSPVTYRAELSPELDRLLDEFGFGEESGAPPYLSLDTKVAEVAIPLFHSALSGAAPGGTPAMMPCTSGYKRRAVGVSDLPPLPPKEIGKKLEISEVFSRLSVGNPVRGVQLGLAPLTISAECNPAPALGAPHEFFPAESSIGKKRER